METITINEKKYELKPVGFKTWSDLEKLGFSLDNIETQRFSTIRVLCAYVMQCDFETVDKEVDAHMANGGSILDLKPLLEWIEESDFFRNIPKQ